MTLIESMTFSKKKPPIRVYIHTTGLEKCFGYNPLDQAKKHVKRTLDSLEEMKEIQKEVPNLNFDYIIAGVWGDESTKEKMIDFVGYRVTGEWPGNPDISFWTSRSGVFDFSGEDVVCGDILIALGKEEEYRRTTKSLEDYISNPPEL
jgi:hypothetical protein